MIAGCACSCWSSSPSRSAASAAAATFKPPRGKVYTGVSGSTSTNPFMQQVGSDVAVFGVFTKWYGQNEYAFRAARQAGARLMLHVSTQDGYGTPELITPRGIARGEGDRYLLSLNRRIAEAGEPGLRAPAGRDEPGQQRLQRVRPQRPLARPEPLDRAPSAAPGGAPR